MKVNNIEPSAQLNIDEKFQDNFFGNSSDNVDEFNVSKQFEVSNNQTMKFKDCVRNLMPMYMNMYIDNLRTKAHGAKVN
jgi:hypothetical protein